MEGRSLFFSRYKMKEKKQCVVSGASKRIGRAPAEAVRTGEDGTVVVNSLPAEAAAHDVVETIDVNGGIDL